MLVFLLSISDGSDHEKITYLYESFHDYLLAYATRKLKDSDSDNPQYDAEDVVQNVFVKVTRSINKIDFSSGKQCLKNYLIAIVNNEIANIFRKQSDFSEFDEEIHSTSAQIFIDSLQIKERYSEVVEAIKGLDDKYRDALYLAYFERKTVKEIAALMGVSAKTVYTRLQRGRILLLESLKEGR